MINKTFAAKRIAEKIKRTCLAHGEVELSSGQKSDYYVDLSKILYSEDLREICFGILENQEENLVVVGGPATGAIPLVVGILQINPMLARTLAMPKRGFFVRKESKDYGKKDLIEGNLLPGDRVLLVEDVVTTGKSLWRAVEAVQDFGCTVGQVISVVDRQQGGAELFAGKNIKYTSLFNAEDLTNG